MTPEIDVIKIFAEKIALEAENYPLEKRIGFIYDTTKELFDSLKRIESARTIVPIREMGDNNSKIEGNTFEPSDPRRHLLDSRPFEDPQRIE
jgi:hypothetical protein